MTAIGALAQLQLGRAYAMQADAARVGRVSTFLTLWKDADPDIPILLEAKAECAKLQLAQSTTLENVGSCGLIHGTTSLSNQPIHCRMKRRSVA